MNMLDPRPVSALVLFLLVLVGIAPLVLLWGILCAYRFPRYAEIICAGFLFELIYGFGAWKGMIPAPMFLAAIFIFLAATLVRLRLRVS